MEYANPGESSRDFQFQLEKEQIIHIIQPYQSTNDEILWKQGLKKLKTYLQENPNVSLQKFSSCFYNKDFYKFIVWQIGQRSTATSVLQKNEKRT